MDLNKGRALPNTNIESNSKVESRNHHSLAGNHRSSCRKSPILLQEITDSLAESTINKGPFQLSGVSSPGVFGKWNFKGLP
jgi:hypothetical protein